MKLIYTCSNCDAIVNQQMQTLQFIKESDLDEESLNEVNLDKVNATSTLNETKIESRKCLKELKIVNKFLELK